MKVMVNMITVNRDNLNSESRIKELRRYWDMSISACNREHSVREFTQVRNYYDTLHSVGYYGTMLVKVVESNENTDKWLYNEIGMYWYRISNGEYQLLIPPLLYQYDFLSAEEVNYTCYNQGTWYNRIVYGGGVVRVSPERRFFNHIRMEGVYGFTIDHLNSSYKGEIFHANGNEHCYGNSLVALENLPKNLDTSFYANFIYQFVFSVNRNDSLWNESMVRDDNALDINCVEDFKSVCKLHMDIIKEILGEQ